MGDGFVPTGVGNSDGGGSKSHRSQAVGKGSGTLTGLDGKATLHPKAGYNGARCEGLGTLSDPQIKGGKNVMFCPTSEQELQTYIKPVLKTLQSCLYREVCAQCVLAGSIMTFIGEVYGNVIVRYDNMFVRVMPPRRGKTNYSLSPRVCRMADDLYVRGDQLYQALLTGGKGKCKACGKPDLHLRGHLHLSIVKIFCPHPACEAMIQDLPTCLDRHWRICHSDAGIRPRALRVTLPVPKCRTRWSKKAGQRERHTARARVISIVPGQKEWMDSLECAEYPVASGSEFKDEGVVTLKPEFALPKRQVEDYEGRVPLRFWKAQSDLIGEVDKWLWRSVEWQIQPERARCQYPMSEDSEAEVTKKRRNKRKKEKNAPTLPKPPACSAC